MTLGQKIARAIREALTVRQGQVLTPDLIHERAGNAAQYVIAVLEEDDPTPRGYEPTDTETPEEMARRLIR